MLAIAGSATILTSVNLLTRQSWPYELALVLRFINHSRVGECQRGGKLWGTWMEPKIPLGKACRSCRDRSRPIAPIALWPWWSHANSSSHGAPSRISFATARAWCSCSTPSRSARLGRQPARWVCPPTRSGPGDSAGPQGTSACTMSRGGGVPPGCPPLDPARVKAVACELGAATEPPLRRQALADITVRAQRALGNPSRRSPGWRLLATDASKPGRYTSWIVPRDPHVAAQAGPSLDWSTGTWEGQPVGPRDHLRSADEKPSLPARVRCHPPRPSAPGRPVPLEPEDRRGGARP